MNLELLRELSVPNDTKILLLVIDGLGGLPNESGRSELEQAHIPQLDRLAQESLCGLTMPVGYGVTPGSGPGHLALFGYDPEKYNVGRGVLEALGIDFDLQSDGRRGARQLLHRRRRRPDHRPPRGPHRHRTIGAALREAVARSSCPGVEVFVEPVTDHRFLLVLRGEGLSDRVTRDRPAARGRAAAAVAGARARGRGDGAAAQRVDREGAEGAARRTRRRTC